MPMVTIFQVDGGPDQNIAFICTRISAFALFLVSVDDHSIFFCGCLGDSYRIFCKRTMSLLNILFNNCSFILYQSDLTEDEAWFVKEIMNKTGNMTDTRESITDFNHQLSIAIWVKKRIQERSAVVSASSTSQATG